MILALLLAARAAAQGPEDLGRALADAARRGGAATAAVARFETPWDAPEGLASAASDAVLSGMAASGRVHVLERERLGDVLSERRLAASGAFGESSVAPRLTAGDALVVGRVVRDGGAWTLRARVVSAATGAVLSEGRAALDVPPGVAAAAEPDAFPTLAVLMDRGHALSETRDAAGLEALAADRAASPGERAAAVLALGEGGTEADLALADALRDDAPLVRFAAATALGRARAPWAAGPLRRLLRADPSWLVRFEAAQALSRYEGTAAEGDLLAARTADPSWRVRRQAAIALTQHD